MAKIIVYNNDTNNFETYYRGEDEPMPYNTGGTLKVREFRGSSTSPTLWTTKRTMQSWNSQRYLWGSSIPVGFSFKRPYERTDMECRANITHGVALDVGQGWTNAQRAALRSQAINSGLWSYVEPVSISPTWVHFDKRFGTPACSTGGYPMLKQGSKNPYVLILQDELNTLRI